MVTEQLYLDSDPSSTLTSETLQEEGPLTIESAPVETSRTVPLPFPGRTMIQVTREMMIYRNVLTAPPMVSYTFINAFTQFPKLTAVNYLIGRYAYFRYKYIVFRIQHASPKTVAGELLVGWFPWDLPSVGSTTVASFQSTRSAYLRNVMPLRSDTQSVSLSDPRDIDVRIPWTFQLPALPIYDLLHAANNESTVGKVPRAGTPYLGFYNSKFENMAVQQGSADLRIYMHIEGLEFLFPCNPDSNPGVTGARPRWVGHMATSFASRVLPAAIAATTLDTSLDTAADLLCSLTGACKPTADKSFIASAAERFSPIEQVTKSFGDPEAFLPSYFGNTLSQLPTSANTIRGTSTTPDARNPLSSETPVHSIESFISRQQILQYQSFTTSPNSYRIPVLPTWGYHENSYRDFSWLNYFGRMARYWRGTLLYTLQVFGNPFVEVELCITITPSFETGTLSMVSPDNGDHLRKYYRFTGNKTLQIPVPYMSLNEYTPISYLDMTNPGGIVGYSDYFNSYLTIQSRVVNTAFDAAARINWCLYYAAGDDFRFYDFKPCGYQNTQTFPPATPEPHVRLTDTVESAALIDFSPLSSPSTLQPLTSIEQLMSNWTRVMDRGNFSGDPSLGGQYDGARFVYPGVETRYASKWDKAIPKLFDITFASTPQNVEIDTIGALSSFFLYYQGGMTFKIWAVLDPAVPTSLDRKIIFITLEDALNTNIQVSDVATTALTSSSHWNFGKGTAITWQPGQPIIDVSLPRRATDAIGFVQSTFDDYSQNPGVDAFKVPRPWTYTNVIPSIPDPNDQFQFIEGDIIHRKIGSDFRLFCETFVPPPRQWATFGNAS